MCCELYLSSCQSSVIDTLAKGLQSDRKECSQCSISPLHAGWYAVVLVFLISIALQSISIQIVLPDQSEVAWETLCHISIPPLEHLLLFQLPGYQLQMHVFNDVVTDYKDIPIPCISFYQWTQEIYTYHLKWIANIFWHQWSFPFWNRSFPCCTVPCTFCTRSSHPFGAQANNIVPAVCEGFCPLQDAP